MGPISRLAAWRAVLQVLEVLEVPWRSTADGEGNGIRDD